MKYWRRCTDGHVHCTTDNGARASTRVSRSERILKDGGDTGEVAMANRKDRKSGAVGPKRTDRPGKRRDIVGELIDLDDLKKVVGGEGGICKECIGCHAV
jgi:hypothetical protein